MSLDDPASALSLEEQQRLLHVIKAIVNPTEGIEPGKPGDTSIVTVEDSSPDSSNAEIVQLALHKLWSCQSTAFVAAAESLADGCRMRESIPIMLEIQNRADHSKRRGGNCVERQESSSSFSILLHNRSLNQ